MPISVIAWNEGQPIKLSGHEALLRNYLAALFEMCGNEKTGLTECQDRHFNLEGFGRNVRRFCGKPWRVDKVSGHTVFVLKRLVGV